MDIIRSIINTLNQIEVKGKDNLDKLLGVILTLEMMIPESEESKETTGEGGDLNG